MAGSLWLTCSVSSSPARGNPILEIENVDLGMLGSALADQNYDNQYTFDPVSGESLIWNDAIDEEPADR
jgi:hypothetical protein